jgi:hypothetical protein
VFDGFRFSCEQNSEGRAVNNQLIALSTSYTLFGNGRHAWYAHSTHILIYLFLLCLWVYLDSPGRFLVALVTKATLARILLTYDIKLEKEGVRPPDKLYGGLALLPNQTARFMLRKQVP